MTQIKKHIGTGGKATTKGVFDALVNIGGIVHGGNFLRRLPLDIPYSVESRIENAVISTSKPSFRNLRLPVSPAPR